MDKLDLLQSYYRVEHSKQLYKSESLCQGTRKSIMHFYTRSRQHKMPIMILTTIRDQTSLHARACGYKMLAVADGVPPR